jgi:ribonuclease P protein subunit RPR2
MRLTKSEQKKIARKSIQNMIEQAETVFMKNQKLADRYIKIALDLRNKFKVELSQSQKKRFCKNCFCFLMPGENCMVRTKNKTLLYHCLNCGNIKKQGLRVKKSLERQN